MIYVSRDGHWRVRVIKRDGIPYARLSHDTLTGIPGGIPLHSDGIHRMGPELTPDGWLVGDFTDISAIRKYVPGEFDDITDFVLAELEKK